MKRKRPTSNKRITSVWGINAAIFLFLISSVLIFARNHQMMALKGKSYLLAKNYPELPRTTQNYPELLDSWYSLINNLRISTSLINSTQKQKLNEKLIIFFLKSMLPIHCCYVTAVVM